MISKGNVENRERRIVRRRCVLIFIPEMNLVSLCDTFAKSFTRTVLTVSRI